MSVNFNLNKVFLAGRLAKDPVVKAINEKMLVANFTVAVSRSYVREDGNRDTDFIACKSYNAAASFVSQYFKKGDPIFIEGEYRIDSYETDGAKTSINYIRVDTVKFVAGKRKEEAGTPDEIQSDNMQTGAEG